MPKKLTKEEFIKKSKEKHGDKYDYSKVEYVNSATKVCIICPEHSEFWQIPRDHTRGIGCSKCGGSCVLTKEEFIEKARKKHGDKYDYSKVDYVNSRTKVCINCREHGEFWQIPRDHLSGYGCSKCSGRYVPTTKEWIASARKVHGDKYDYSKVEYVNSQTKVCINCREHGEFWQTPNNHLSGYGCSKCSGLYVPTTEEWIASARKTHGDKYDYSMVKYVKANTKICIICPKHGEFWQIPGDHIRGIGCSKCGGTSALTKEEFIKKAHEVHSEKYDYYKVHYVNNRTKVCIKCPEHGEFWQTPKSHLKGRGCQTCNLSHLERSVMNYLDEHGITYDYQKRFKWLGLQSLDFYLPDYNVGIECQGGQHYEPADYFGGEDGFKQTLERDKRKFKKCKKNGIKVLYYSNLGIEYPYEVFEDLDLLFKEIKN